MNNNKKANLDILELIKNLTLYSNMPSQNGVGSFDMNNCSEKIEHAA